MSPDDKYDKIRPYDDDESGDAGSSGSQGGKIEFVDFLDSHATRRDDQLSGEEKKHLLLTHKDKHESIVKHQKDKIEQNKNKKEGKPAYGLDAATSGLSGGGGGDWKYKDNPALKNFGKGVDNTVIGLPNEIKADTNQAEQDALQEELRLQFGMQPTHSPPKPQGPF